MSTQSQAWKLGAVILQNLPEMSGEVMQGWIENPKALQKVLRETLCPVKFKVWKTIKLGTPGLKTVDDFRKAIADAGVKISDEANDIFGKPQFKVAEKDAEVDLVVVSVGELGFKNSPTSKQVYSRAKELGLQLCPNEVGLQLRLQYWYQPRGERLVVAMEPITASAGNLGLFNVAHDADGLWLDTYYGPPILVWRLDAQFVFVRPRK
jgi:hypothetical protein